MRIEDYRNMLRTQDMPSLLGIRSLLDGEKYPERLLAAEEEILRRRKAGKTGGRADPSDADSEPQKDFSAKWITFHLFMYSYLLIGAFLPFEGLWFKIPFVTGAIAFVIAYFAYLTCPFCKQHPKAIISFLPGIPFVPPRRCKHCHKDLWT